jgi:hypothetical protein
MEMLAADQIRTPASLLLDHWWYASIRQKIGYARWYPQAPASRA